MNQKFKRYLEAKREGKSVEDCVRAALPAVDENSPRFKNWVMDAETVYTDIAKTIEIEGLNNPKKTPAKKPIVKAAKPEIETEEQV